MDAPWKSPVLARLLAPLGAVWGVGMSARRALYGAGALRSHRLTVPVVSVGNLTVGGVGKTPFVSYLLDRLPDALRPALVLSRGYGPALVRDGVTLNDEGHMLRRRHAQVGIVQGADRVAAIRPVLASREVGVVLLDDGAQHLRLARDLEVVLLDARSLSAPRRCLPAGPWRERLGAVAAADLLVITHADRVAAEVRAELAVELRRRAPGASVVCARHGVVGLVEPGGAGELVPTSLAGVRVGLVSGIGDPGSFRTTVEQLGAKVVRALDYPDHHAYRPEDLDAIRTLAREVDLDLTTAKDAPKLDAEPSPKLRVLEVAIDLGDDAPVVDALLADLVVGGGSG